MNSRELEEIIELLSRAPGAALEVLESTGQVTLPPFDQVRVEPGELRELVPPARQVDVVILLEQGRVVFVVLVEVQAGRDEDKPFTWPFYVAALRARFRCPVCLMVLALSDEVAAWAARPIALGQPESSFAPLVVRREAFPRVTDPEEAKREPYKAILAVVLHGHEAGAELLAVAAAAGAETLPENERDMWLELMALSLNEVSRKLLEAMMNIQDFRERSVWAKEARIEGKREGLLEGKREGKREGERKGLREAVDVACELLSIELTAERQAYLASLDVDGLEALLASIRKQRAWPGSSG